MNPDNLRLDFDPCRSAKIRGELTLTSLVQLGTIDYATGLRLQRQLVELRKEGKIGNVLLLLEHSPVITLGRNAKAANVIASLDLLTQRGVELFECDRGGDVTFHGPGQIVGYPIFDLRGFATPNGGRKTLGAVDFVIPSKRIQGLTGVWTDAGSAHARAGTAAVGQAQGRLSAVQRSEASPQESRASGHEAKLAAIGVHI